MSNDELIHKAIELQYEIDVKLRETYKKHGKDLTEAITNGFNRAVYECAYKNITATIEMLKRVL